MQEPKINSDANQVVLPAVHGSPDIQHKDLETVFSFIQQLSAIKNKDCLTKAISQVMDDLQMSTGFYINTLDEFDGSLNLFLSSPDSGRLTSSDVEKFTSTKNVNDKIVSRVLKTEEPVLLDVNELIDVGSIPPYVLFWKSAGIRRMTAINLRFGQKNIGILWMIPGIIRFDLLKVIRAQISIVMANLVIPDGKRPALPSNEDNDQVITENKIIPGASFNEQHRYGELIGSSQEMQHVYSLVKKVAKTQSSVLIMGETGTGKELIAKAIHELSPRKGRLMIKINCAALPHDLIESELFGHERGSFTGATERRIGKFEMANNSTLFLDEVGELPLNLQVKLLRALQEREIERVGGLSVIKTDVRIIAATNRDLLKEVNNGTFRSDLYFRLNVFPILLPALRERRGDIPALAAHFLNKFLTAEFKGKVTFSRRVIKLLSAYNWPGNVRELEHLIERTVVINTDPVIRDINLPHTSEQDEKGCSPEYIKSIDEVERDHIVMILKMCNGKVAGIGGAAEILKIPSTTLNSKIRRLHIKKQHTISQPGMAGTF